MWRLPWRGRRKTRYGRRYFELRMGWHKIVMETPWSEDLEGWTFPEVGGYALSGGGGEIVLGRVATMTDAAYSTAQASKLVMTQPGYFSGFSEPRDTMTDAV